MSGSRFGETVWIPFKALFKLDLTFPSFGIYRVVSMQADRLTCQIYIWSTSLSDGGVINWAK